MNLSYWELKNWFTNVDYTIVGSGIVGLHAALRLRERFPTCKILVLEKGMLPQGASTKNAGFACFGSLSEMVSDLQSHNAEDVLALVQKRLKGLRLLRNTLGDNALDFQQHGGYELFENHDPLYERCLSQMNTVNELLRPLFNEDVFVKCSNIFGFANVQNDMIYNSFEAQIDTGNMMQALLKHATAQDILILNMQKVTAYDEQADHVVVSLGEFEFKSKKLLFATNGYASALTDNAVVPARAQALVTTPIKDLKFKGTFHLDEGFYYFRNIGDRILLGGGRNLDIAGETTEEFGQTNLIQDRLNQLLTDVILPHTEFQVEHRWSGIMGMGPQKYPIVKQLSEHTYCGVRLGGMGVAIGSIVGSELADLI
jgi:glycine/D-amino acid oxidase-like deaminating enzyme